MNERQVAECFGANWAFRLRLHEPNRYPIANLGVPIAIWLAGLIITAVRGVWPVFIGNPLAYTGPLAIMIGLAAFGWYTVAFPRILMNIYPALEKPQVFKPIIEKWATRLTNRLWVIVLIAGPIAVFNMIDLLQFWTNPQVFWPGTLPSANWVLNPHPLIFALYYSSFSVFGAAWLISNGLVMIVTSVIIIFELLNTPIKLAFHRQLHSVGDLSIGLALWSVLPVITTIGASAFEQQPTDALKLSSAVQSGLVAVVLLIGFLAPTLIARQSIIDAKYRRLVILGKLQHSNYQAMSEAADKPYLEQLHTVLEQVHDANQALQEIDAIPSWPISLGGTLQLIVAGLIPLVGLIINLIPKS